MQKLDSYGIVRLLLFWGVCTSFASIGHAQEAEPRSQGELRDHITFLSTFDETTSADIAKGDGRLFTAENRRSLDDATPGLQDPDVVLATGRGLVGDALEFKKKQRLITFYKAEGNVAFSATAWSGSLSFWLQLDPATDLEPGYCDPIQITDSAYNDAAIWIDFTKDNPRNLRLGIIGDLKSWNPDDMPPDGNPEFERRLVTVTRPPFARGKWTHIVINFLGLNSDRGKSEFYIDGILKGSLDVKDPFTWDEGKARILLGLNYVGLFDELAIFDRPLSEVEVKALYGVKGGITSILRANP
jgi:hypothetical protein